MTIKCAIYTRVSTTEQSDKGHSLPSQLQACRKYAERTDMEVVAEYQDDFTGSRIDRPQLQALLNQAQSRVIDAVVVYESSRWGRDVRVLLELRDILVNAGVELHYNSRGKVDLITPLGIYMYTNEASFNQLWKAMIIEATSRGKNHKAEGNKTPRAG